MVDLAVSGGAEGAITRLGVAGFCKIQALSTRYNDTPEKACRPFSVDRDGFILGEGAGILILEELEHARARGAHIYGEICGYGMTCDAYHLTAPNPEGDGAARAMLNAIADAGITPEDIDYINAHGTSTPVNDLMETKAIKQAFGAHAYKLKVSSTKSMTSHMVAAAGGSKRSSLSWLYVTGTIPVHSIWITPILSVILTMCPTKGSPGRSAMHSRNHWVSAGITGHWSSGNMKDSKKELVW